MTAVVLAAVATAFNLICSGSWTYGDGPDGARNGPTQSFRSEIRIDLVKSRYCEDACTETKPIASFSNTEIKLQDRTTTPYKDMAGETVNRESGDYFLYVRFGDHVDVKSGTCQAAPFSGFPEPKF